MVSTTVPRRVARMERVRQRLERWRGTRTHPRSPIPDDVWAAAVALARQHGVYQTARAVRIDYGALKAHLAAADHTARGGVAPTFVELAPPTPRGAGECVIEIARATVCIRVPGLTLADLATLSRTLAGGDA